MALWTPLVRQGRWDSFHPVPREPLQHGQGRKAGSQLLVMPSSSKLDLRQHLWGLAAGPALGPAAPRSPSSTPSPSPERLPELRCCFPGTKQGHRSFLGHQDTERDEDSIAGLQAGQGSSGAKGLSRVVDCHMVLGMQRQQRERGTS
ncbi:hypothetical protein DUI87_14524 [Hirundo rustica rustica]|uniref:Uncharacterized protein n=1 Tax=Hirundo rustica rustica TaxID=333673 RepID=A0A3M0K517_HIRRU|nr:hypothetical protein DUI87_14524 [Hirundo rustica rustica]